MSAVPAALRTALVIGVLTVSEPTSAGQPFSFEIALASHAIALIRETAIEQVRLWRVLAAIERLDRSGSLCPGIPVC